MVDVVVTILPQDRATVTSVRVFAQGSFNKLFLIESIDKEYIVRIPWPDHRSEERLLSEVGTMIFVREHRNIPVPHVFAWASTSDNPTGAPYIIMEKLSGTHRSAQGWFTGSSWDERLRFLDELARIHAELVRPLPFSEIGNIYLKDSTISRFSDIKNVKDVNETFEIGPPLAGLKVIGTEAAEGSWVTMPPSELPATTILATWRAILKNEYTSCHEHWSRRVDDDVIISEEEMNSYSWAGGRGEQRVSNFADVFVNLHALMSGFTPSQSDLALGLWHEDIAFRNILVDDKDNCRILGVLDWEDCHTVPLSLCARYPEELLDTGGWSVFPDDVTTVKRVEGIDWEEFTETEEVDTTYLRWYYRAQVALLDARFNARLWKESDRALKINSLVMGSWKSWLKEAPLIAELAEEAAKRKYDEAKRLECCDWRSMRY